MRKKDYQYGDGLGNLPYRLAAYALLIGLAVRLVMWVVNMIRG